MFRKLTTTSSRTLRAAHARPFSVSAARPVSDKEHATAKAKKNNANDVQSANAKSGMDASKSGTGGSATENKDSAGGVAKAKREHPEAPDPAIGMQDERGGRGG